MLEVYRLTSSFDENRVLRGVNLTVKRGEIVTLLGPSGCGKTTLLRIIAGLETPDSGRVLAEGQDITNMQVHKRDFGLMFQEFALFPHMDVANNVMFGLKMRKMREAERVNRMREVLEVVGLSEFADRDVAQLSGGEKQRVALARSLAPNPRLLMLDEPLGSLDAGLRKRLVVDLRKIIKKIGLTSVHVTHDQQEAFAIADRIAIMNDGRIEQFDEPMEIYRRPRTEFIARFLGFTNIIPVLDYQDGQIITQIGAFDFPTQPESILIHPDALSITSDEGLPGEVIESVFMGNTYELKVEAQGMLFTLSVYAINAPKVGQQVYLSFSPESMIPLWSPEVVHGK